MAWKDLLRNLRPQGKPALDDAYERAVEKARGWSPVSSPLRDVPVPPGGARDSVTPPSGTQANVMPGQSARPKGGELHHPGKIVVSDREDTAYRRKTSAIEFIQKRYQPFGDQVASTVLIYALQPRGIQRLLARLDIDPHNNDPMDHEEVIQFLQVEGVNSFCQRLGVRTGPEESPSPAQKELDTRPTPDPRPRTSPQAMRPTPPGTGVSPVLKLEGEQFQPVRIQADVKRRSALGKSSADSSTGARGVAGEKPKTPSAPEKAPLVKASTVAPTVGDAAAKVQEPGPSPRKPPSASPHTGPSHLETTSATGTSATPEMPVSSKKDRPTTKYPGLWRRRTATSNEDTQEIHPRKASVTPLPPDVQKPGDPAADDYLRRMVNQHTRDFVDRGVEPGPSEEPSKNADPPTNQEK